MAQDRTPRETAERLVRMSRDAVALVAELDRAGETAEQIYEFAQRSVRAKSVADGIVWRVNHSEPLALWITAVHDALAFLESHKDPKADMKDAFVVENFAAEVIGDYKRCRDYEIQCRRVPFTLEEWLASFEGAIGRMEGNLAAGLEQIATVNGQHHKEWRGKEISVAQELPAKVARRDFETYDIVGYARQIRDTALAAHSDHRNE